MQFITKEEYVQKRESIIQKIAQGAIFIYPSDTIYRVGCDATNEQAVAHLRHVKKTNMPFSVVAPSKQWVRKHCLLDEPSEDALDLLPGRYVLVLPLENKDAVARSTLTGDLIGVRMPRHWSQELAALLGRPIISTSANISAHDYMTDRHNIHPELKRIVDFCLYEGPIEGTRVHVLNTTIEDDS